MEFNKMVEPITNFNPLEIQNNFPIFSVQETDNSHEIPIVGTDNSEQLNGTDGNDYIEGKRGDDIITLRLGRDRIVINRGDGVVRIIGFNGVGKGSNPPQSVIDTVDILQFKGAGLVSERMALQEKVCLTNI